MVRTVPLSIIRSFSLYTQQWYNNNNNNNNNNMQLGYNQVAVVILRVYVPS